MLEKYEPIDNSVMGTELVDLIPGVGLITRHERRRNEVGISLREYYITTPLEGPQHPQLKPAERSKVFESLFSIYHGVQTVTIFSIAYDGIQALEKLL